MEKYDIQTPMHINLTYPYSDKYEYETYLEKINLDEERINDIKSGKGFIIQSTRSITKDLKSQNGIFSSRYGSTISDVDSFNGKYRCKCGMTKGSIMHGERCKVCNHIVKYYDDDVSIFGWFILKDKYYVIHPNIYRSLEALIGVSRLARILEPEVVVNSNGKVVSIGNPSKKDEPFKGIGMMEFKNRYQEIIDFYYSKYPSKKALYEYLMSCKDMTFTHSIPVFSALLRPSKLEAGSLKYETTNEYFMMLTKLVHDCNKDLLEMDQRLKEKLNTLNDIQIQFNNVYEEIKNILAKKKGDIRSSISGRYSFTSRSVIRQDPYLRANEIRLPFHGLLELYQQVIINILVKTQNLTYSAAYKKWYKCQVKGFDQTIYDILDGLIKDSGGLPFLIK